MLSKVYVIVLLVCISVCYTTAGIVRIDAGSKVNVQNAESQPTETTPVITQEDATEESATLKVTVPDVDEPTVPLSRDEDASIKIGVGIIDPPTDTIVEITQSPVIEFAPKAIATLDPAPGTLEDLEVVLEQQMEDSKQVNSAELKQQIQKSAKLLLLSTPKLNEKPKEQEENIEEPEEVPRDETTDQTELSTTPVTIKDEDKCKKSTDEQKKKTENEKQGSIESDEKSKEDSNSKESSEVKCTDDKKSSTEESKTDDATESDLKPDDTTAIATEQMFEPINDNVASSVLIEIEPEYELIESDHDDHYETFTHIDSDVHLQPIVQSVEIVPSSLDGDLIVSYVHNWH